MRHILVVLAKGCFMNLTIAIESKYVPHFNSKHCFTNAIFPPLKKQNKLPELAEYFWWITATERSLKQN